MPGPRANYECAHCTAVEFGPEPTSIVVYDDLPIKSTRCPVCGWKKGFRRRFDAINVSTTGHRVALVLDKMMEPQLNQASMMKDDAKRSERRLAEDHQRAIEILPEPQRPAMREALADGPVRWLPPHQANLGMVNPVARSDSRNHIFPHIKRRLRPIPA
jgi:hypothetical protein